jgi:hypothetical protein
MIIALRLKATQFLSNPSAWHSCDAIASDVQNVGTVGYLISFGPMVCMRSKAWLATRVSLRLARLRSTRAAVPVPGLLAHAEVTKKT